MMATSGNRSNSTALKTYSKRVSSMDISSKKRKRSEDPSTISCTLDKPKATRRLIQDYFKPKQINPPSSPSSMSSKQNSSDPVEPASTPPSSPPPSSPPPVLSTAAQRILQRPKRRLSARPHISKFSSSIISSCDDENREPISKASSKKHAECTITTLRLPLKSTNTNLQQVQLDLGVPAMKQCRACGMEYNSTAPEDRKLHDEFHKRKVKAIQPTRGPPGRLSKTTQVDGEIHEIRTLDCRGPVQSRAHFEQALETMYADLSGDQIVSEDLWSEITNPIRSSILNTVPKFTVLMLLIDRSPAAILIVERICKGGGYLDDFRSSQTESNGHDSDRFRGYGKPDVVKTALMSVDRIWVGEKHRRKGLATALINHARNVLIPGLEIRRSQVAFSWPTTLGRALATRYSLGQHEEAIPFLVNLADCPGV